MLLRNSELLAGRLGKATLGGGNKAGLFQVCKCVVDTVPHILLHQVSLPCLLSPHAGLRRLLETGEHTGVGQTWLG